MSYQALDFLEFLPTSDLDWLMATAQPKTILATGLLFQEGVVGEYVYFVSDGLFDVCVRDSSGQERLIARLGRGQIIGEMSWLDSQPTSASIRATESSSVLALPVFALEQRIKADIAFAARFFRALARTTTQRLRSANAQYANARPSASLLTLLDGADPTSAAFQHLNSFKELLVLADKRGLENRGEVPANLREQVRDKFRFLVETTNSVINQSGTSDAAKQALGQYVQKEFLPYIQLATNTERFYSKPRGYAGDYLSIENIYNNVPAGVGRIGPLIDECFLTSPTSYAVRNRRLLLKEQIKRIAEERGRPIRITSLACGPARELFDAAAELGSDLLDVTAVDIDQEALALLSERTSAKNLKVRALHGNLIYLAAGHQKLDIPPQDFVYSIGLIDYFNDAFVERFLGWIHGLLAPGGTVLLGNFHPRNPDRAFMDHVLNWRLVHRDEDKMNELFTASKFKRPCTRILFEEQKINLFAECVKPG